MITSSSMKYRHIVQHISLWSSKKPQPKKTAPRANHHSSTPKRIYLSPPHMGGEELPFVQEAFDSDYIAPLGPQVAAFEREFKE